VKTLVSRIAVAAALVGATTIAADAGKARSHHRATAKAATYVVAAAPQPVQKTYTYRYYGGPKGQMWPAPPQ
jgi:hypothetical protein